MVICFDCSKEGKTALDLLVATQKFRDPAEAISMALVNYEVLHRALADGRSLVPHGTLIMQQENIAPIASNGATETKIDPATAHQQKFRLPPIFSLNAASLEGLGLVSVESDVTPPGEISPKDWPWGQYNRFLPLKATCRALLNLTHDHPAGMLVDEAAKKISYEACDLGDCLSASDELYRRPREFALGAAFPTTGLRGGESRSRFQTQFVAALKQGRLIGLPAELRFAAIDDSKEPKLKLTKAGAEFALLPNPLLDADRITNGPKWSDTETRFLLDHIRRAVPAEASAYVAIIEGIEAGENTPDKLDRYLRTRFDLPGEDDIKTTFLSTQRTGAVSRMADLNLLYREKSGLRVTYTLTHVGEHFGSQFSKLS